MMSKADIARCYLALQTMYPNQKKRHRNSIWFLASCAYGEERICTNTSFVCLLVSLQSLVYLCNLDVCLRARYPGQYNLMKKVMTIMEQLPTLTLKQKQTKFLPLDGAASNTPKSERKRKAEPPFLRCVTAIP